MHLQYDCAGHFFISSLVELLCFLPSILLIRDPTFILKDIFGFLILYL